ncbi:hypothetical protein A3D77_02955 [Candidatus Gottesmanbacteria bacterium RIFCSPHIGHO2_02_FULL_39_11]|uniref:Uncharacterized protein n=1 Tax=Candidatus Gottesmanbacteria bacterium RIFCSPHIGHO2_02_FULL_39_11 TaxID=1798382 RepID=A0A1F5ZWK1_9BACT|nr:MAG: hypothetical protein A3D77_02955 [Candidatus Gottesmanbacteria bacterium RIFCSPHIGHO2_02_FULL_39_11]
MQGAQEDGITVVFTPHASPYWQDHDLRDIKPETSISNKKAADSARILISRFKPDVVVHGQLPDPRIGQDGNMIPVNADFVARSKMSSAPLAIESEQIGIDEELTADVHLPRDTSGVMVVLPDERMTLSKNSTLPPKVLFRAQS